MEQNLLPKIAVVILAGGKSSRMGENKALLPDACEGNRDLLGRAFTLAESLLDALGQTKESIYVSGGYSGYSCIPDIFLKAGPLGGIHAALDFVLTKRKDKYEYLLFIPVDMPELKVTTLARLVQCGVDTRAVSFKGFELPMLMHIERDIETLLVKRLGKASRGVILSLHAFLQTVGALKIKHLKEYRHEFINVNTPSDFETWRVRAHI